MINKSDLGIICSLPTELLLHIFKYLPPKALLTCKIVCHRWYIFVGNLTTNEKLWRQHCRRDYPDVFQRAHLKSNPQLSWYQLYRSLTLWPKLTFAQETRYEFAVVKHPRDEIIGCQVLSDGVVGVHKTDTIIYYDVNILKKTKRNKIEGHFYKYTENDEYILSQDCRLQLSVVKKASPDCSAEITVTLKSVIMFLHVKNVIYYITFDKDLCLCKHVDGQFKNMVLEHVPHGVRLLGCRNGVLYLLTYKRAVYVLVNNKLRKIDNIEGSTHTPWQLIKYDKLEQIYDNRFIDWTSSLCGIVPISPSYDIISLCSYGHMTFTGSYHGVLRIFYSQSTTEIFELFNSKPLKTYNFIEHQDNQEELIVYPVLNIDVMEGVDSHKLIVALPNKIVVINFDHSYQVFSGVGV